MPRAADSHPLRLMLLWHFHQPEYTDPDTGAPALPWTRLHALKDYADMAERLARHPGVRATINVVPSLVDQLGALARDAPLPDPFLEVARRDASGLSPEQKRFVVTHFFSFNRQTLARDLPRVHELAALRGDHGAEAVPQSVVDRFDESAVRDLQVLFHLAWSGPLLRADHRVAALRAKGRRFTEDDKHALLDVQQAFLRDVLPRWRRLAEAGHVEFSTSAYFHPILPLLCGLEAALEALPGLKLPTAPFGHPEDARLQIAAALDAHERCFGSRPAGGWPPEGAISETALRLMGEAGYRWAASDEDVLFGSLAERLPGDPRAAEIRRGALLYRPWRHGAGPVLLFRDHDLSDRIGFVYAAWRPRVAAEDFLSRLLRLRDMLPDEEGPYTVSVILDGENAWEYYPDNASEFFDALYSGLESERRIRTVTASEAADAAASRPLPSIVAGSWISRNLATWIGHPEKNRAWERLAEARRVVAERRGAPRLGDPAWRALLAAEGSDWFWWFGDDHPTPYAFEFDAAFRRQLRAAYRAVDVEPPAVLSQPIRERGPRGFHLPVASIRPRIDGRVTDYFEWLPAGRTDAASGAMQSATCLVREMHYGTDGERLYLRIDPLEPPATGSLGGAILAVRVPGFPERTVRVALPAAGSAVVGAVEIAVDRVVEMSMPLAALAGEEGSLRFQVEVETAVGATQRVPSDGSLLLPSPEEDPSRFDWYV